MLEEEDTGNNNTNASLMRLGGRATIPFIDKKATNSEKKERSGQSDSDNSVDDKKRISVPIFASAHKTKSTFDAAAMHPASANKHVAKDVDMLSSSIKIKKSMEIQWLDNMELFEILDSSGMETIGFREFCALIFLVSAAESKQLL